jgi:hypothetical protein
MITRRIPNEQESTPVPELNIEPTPFSLTNNLPPQAADVTCLIIPPRSRTNSICTSYNDRSRANSHSSMNDQNDRQIIL